MLNNVNPELSELMNLLRTVSHNQTKYEIYFLKI